jgi:16S rRNA (cytidine1402-2'-O)-methyltransferase
MSGNLYLVPTPIGNYDDITLRALNILRSVDLIVGEEHKECRRILKHYGIEKSVELLNEHNEEKNSDNILAILKEGKNIALTSDSGTPVFSDPGLTLVKKAIDNGIKIVPLPGASSIIPALIVSGFDIDKFVFVGWLSPKSQERIKELRNLIDEKRTMVLMDTPYRLLQLLKDICAVIGSYRRVCVAFDLTMSTEKIFYGSVKELVENFSRNKIKGEFVLVVEGKNKRAQ